MNYKTNKVKRRKKNRERRDESENCFHWDQFTNRGGIPFIGFDTCIQKTFI